MSKTEIMAELMTMSVEDRADVLELLFQLRERDEPSKSDGPTQEEKRLLDEAWQEYENDPSSAVPWETVRDELFRRPH